MNFTVKGQKPKDGKMAATVTISKEDVNSAVAKAYKEIANKYNFQGFRRGHAPRPVINAMVGKQSVLADASNELLGQVEPLYLNELDIVPVGDVDYGEDLEPAKENEDFTVNVIITLIPESKLKSYDNVEINMPPEEVTDAEIEMQSEKLLTYQAKIEEVTNRAAKADDFAVLKIEDVKGAKDYVSDNKMIIVGMGVLPKEIEDAVVGMKLNDVKNVKFTIKPKEEGKKSTSAEAKITLTKIEEQKVPELTDEFCKSSLGFDSVEEYKKSLADEIKKDKDKQLPSLKEDRAITALTERLEIDEIPEEYVKQVYNGILNQFLENIQAQGMDLNTFMQQRGITPEQLMSDMQLNAERQAHESIALDAYAKELKLEATEDDVFDEVAKAVPKNDVEKYIKQLTQGGQMPNIRRTIIRTKAVKHLVDNAKVKIVDEIAEQRKKDAKKSASKASTKKSATKKAPVKKNTTNK